MSAGQTNQATPLTPGATGKLSLPVCLLPRPRAHKFARATPQWDAPDGKAPVAPTYEVLGATKHQELNA